ncbi:MspA family porin [Nocardia sp. NPDC059091]|uniref:MspA family porin n=1 Tax=unclassified Nocardia TaxID=2637762 RepID=UPI00368A15C0
MIIKTAVSGVIAAASLFCGTAGIAHADGGLAPHERITSAPNGMTVTVGQSDSAARPVPPMNGWPTSREVYLDNTFYGRVEGGTGKIRYGYFAGCAVDLDVKFDVEAKVGVDADASVGATASLTEVTPTASVAITPEISGSVGVDLSIKPGAIKDIKLGEKQLSGPDTGYALNRDYRLTVDGCAGPLTIKAYTIIEATSPGADATDEIMGDPIVL